MSALTPFLSFSIFATDVEVWSLNLSIGGPQQWGPLSMCISGRIHQEKLGEQFPALVIMNRGPASHPTGLLNNTLQWDGRGDPPTTALM